MSYHDDISLALNSAVVAGGKDLRARADNGTLEVAIANADTMSVAFTSFVFSTDRLATSETAQLSRIADQLASKLTYLLEPLRIVEVDGNDQLIFKHAISTIETPRAVANYFSQQS